jgi:hypothetical protein
MSTEAWASLQVRLAAAYAALTEAAASLAPELRDRSGVCGVWSPQDVVAHLAGWDREAARRFRVLLAGPVIDRIYDVDAFNARSVAARRHLSWDEALGELQAAHEALRRIIEHGDAEAAIADPRFREWLLGRSRDYEHHAAQLRAWLRLPPCITPGPTICGGGRGRGTHPERPKLPSNAHSAGRLERG